MLLSKFNLLILSLIFSSASLANFTEKECLDSSFELKVTHKDKRTFGLAKVSLSIVKDKCEMIVKHDKFKFVKNEWKVDVCREPVHIKSGVKGVEVLKKKGPCPNKKSADFCDALKSIKEVVQDDGLIFAPGEKENISTDHGKIYCSYQLLRGYLDSDRIYSRYAQPKKMIREVVIEKEAPSAEATPEPFEGRPAVDPTPPESKGQTGSF
jgi:hypothetical protein